MTGYVRKFNENAAMSFKANNKQPLKNHNKIWEKVEKLLKIDFDSKPVYGNDDDNKYIKIKIKIYAGSMITNFHNKKMPKEEVPCNCLSIIMLDSVIKAIILKHFWKNANMNQKKTKIENLIDDDLEKSESDEADSHSNNVTESDNDNDE